MVDRAGVCVRGAVSARSSGSVRARFGPGPAQVGLADGVPAGEGKAVDEDLGRVLGVEPHLGRDVRAQVCADHRGEGQLTVGRGPARGEQEGEDAVGDALDPPVIAQLVQGAEGPVDGGPPQIGLRAEALVEQVAADPQLVVHRTQRHAVVSVHRKSIDNRGHHLVGRGELRVLARAPARAGDRRGGHIANLAGFDGFTEDELRGVERDNALRLFPRFA